MSERDLPERLARYDGGHVKLRRIALTREQLPGLTSFPATDKRKDPRYKWFTANYGTSCWELDAMDPRDLRDCVEGEIRKLIEPTRAEFDAALPALYGRGFPETGSGHRQLRPSRN